ncbi:hypothetical protein BDV93DRAFT_332664 [Ceratobasidium sp. AG-I]|nr:hypothetical protein BDV93DRAFT_332664 [Ceratobasidium sp. AG-I]
MIQASPNLRSLDLTILTRFGWNATPWPNSSPFPVKVFLDLCIYRADGSADPNWVSFFETPETNKFRSFLQLHPHLHTVSINSKEKINGYDNVDPETLAGLFPSLRHFEGPAFLCEALVQSTLAPRLETLGISRTGPTNKLLLKVARKTTHLPELRTLKLMLYGATDNIKSTLSGMLVATPKLTHLYVSHISTSQLKSLPNALQRTSNLQILSTLFPEDPEMLLDLAKSLVAVCPRLEYLYKTSPPRDRRYWRVVRKDGEAVGVDLRGFRGDTPRYWEDD